MKITCTLLSLCCCILFLSTFAKGESRVTRKGDTGDIGEKFPFCPTDKKTAKEMQEIIANLTQSTTSQVQLPPFDSRKELRRVRSTSSCMFTPPRCIFFSLRIAEGAAFIQRPMKDCCSDCSNGYARCTSTNKECFACIDTWTSCMNKCTELHFCSFFRGWKGSSGSSLGGNKGFRHPIANPCPTKKVKNGGSYCIKRSCYPIRV